MKEFSSQKVFFPQYSKIITEMKKFNLIGKGVKQLANAGKYIEEIYTNFFLV